MECLRIHNNGISGLNEQANSMRPATGGDGGGELGSNEPSVPAFIKERVVIEKAATVEKRFAAGDEGQTEDANVSLSPGGMLEPDEIAISGFACDDDMSDDDAAVGSADQPGYACDDDMSDDDAAMGAADQVVVPISFPAVDDCEDGAHFACDDDELSEDEAATPSERDVACPIGKADVIAESNADRPSATPLRNTREAPAAARAIATKIQALKASISEKQALKEKLMQEEEYLEAHSAKEHIQEHQQELEEIRQDLLSKLPSASRSAHRPPNVSDAQSTSATETVSASHAVSSDALGEPVSAGEASHEQPEEGETVHGSGDACASADSNEVSSANPAAVASKISIEWLEHSADLLKVSGDTSERPFLLPKDVYERLYDHQRTGVGWLAKLWREGHGGILADEMGLGKTIQLCSLLNGTRKAGATHALIILPVTLLEQWRREAAIWCPGWPVYVYHGNKEQRTQALQGIRRPEGGVLLASYSMFSNSDILFEVVIDEAIKEVARDQKKGGRQKRNVALEKASVVEAELPPGELPKIGETKAWDFVICDEAHRIKSIASLCSKSLRRVRSRCRLLLTGTPVQNALQDLWSLMDFAQPGLLGNHATFVKHFSDPIDKGSVRGAGPFQVALKQQLSQQLRALIRPHVLRRTKKTSGLLGSDVTIDEEMEEYERILEEEFGEDTGRGPEQKTLPPKQETVIWLLPTDEQTEIYKKVLEKSDIIREASNKAKLGIEVFLAIGLLKRLCNHPLLALPTPKSEAWREILDEAIESLGKDQRSGGMVKEDSPAKNEDAEQLVSEGAVNDPLAGELGLSNGATGAVSDDARAGRAAEMMIRRLPKTADALLAQSSKLRCMALLLPGLAARGHRTLVFSQSVKMLDLLQICVLKPHGLRCLRLDGQTEAATRIEKVTKFNEQRDRFQCMLLTTNVGGVGLNLTGADRVVIVDPSWNPANDAQAVDRAYRIGQDREVKVYRLVTSGLIEDKMFRLQTFKMGLTHVALEGDSQQRIFTNKEIRALFSWTDPAEGETRKLLADAHGDDVGQVAKKAAEEDGAEADGWLGPWISAGVSDFSAVVPQTGDSSGGNDGGSNKCTKKDMDEVAVQVETVKQKLDSAHERLQEAVEARQAAESRSETLDREASDAVVAFANAQSDRAQAEKVLKESGAALVQAKRAEEKLQGRVLRAVRQLTQAEEHHSRLAQECKKNRELASATGKVSQEAASATRTAEDILSQAITAVSSALNDFVDRNGKAVGAGAVDACPSATKCAAKDLDRLRVFLDDAIIRQSALEAHEADLMALEEGDTLGLESLEKKAGDSGNIESTGHSDSHQVVAEANESKDESVGKSPAQIREQEWIKLFNEFQTLLRLTEIAREKVATAIHGLAESGEAFIQSFQKTQARVAKPDEVRSCRQLAKSAFKSLRPAWAALQRSQNSWANATIARHKAAQKLLAADVALAIDEGPLSEVRREHSDVMAENEARRTSRVASEAALADAEAALEAAEAFEVKSRSLRDELRSEAVVAKYAIKAARLDERSATSEQRTSIKQNEKIEKAKLRVEEAKSSAVKRLQSEIYDANQVEYAHYECKQRRKGGLIAQSGISILQAERERSSDALKDARLACEQARRAELVANQRLQRASRLMMEAQEQQPRLVQSRQNAVDGASTTLKAAHEANGTLRSAEEALSKAVANAYEALRIVGEDGKAKSGGVVDAPASIVKQTLKAMDHMQAALDIATIRGVELEALEDDLVELEGAPLEHANAPSGDDRSTGQMYEAICTELQDQERRDEVKQKLEEGLPQMLENAEAARQAATSAVETMVIAGQTLADSFQATDAAKPELMKAAISATRNSFKQLNAAWLSAKRAREAWVRSSAARRRASRKCATAVAACSVGENAFAAATAEQEEATAEVETCKSARQAFDDALAELEKEDASRKAAARAQEEQESQQQKGSSAEQSVQRPTKRLKAKTAVTDM